MTAIERFAEFLRNEADNCPVPRELLEAIHVEAPWFVLADAVALGRNADLSPQERKNLGLRVAALGADPASLYELTVDDGRREPFYPDGDRPATPATEDAIMTFLETYGHGSSPEEDELVERLIFNPQPDYFPVEAGENVPLDAADEQDAAIDAFLENYKGLPEADDSEEVHVELPTSKPTPVPPSPYPDPEMPTNQQPATGMSDSLARIFIRQGRYERAYEILSRQVLNNPKKSVYFADQLRFLRLLIKATGVNS